MSRLRAAAILALLAIASVVASFAAPVAHGADASFALDVSRRGDFVAQTNLVQCVGASMQMMLNIVGRDDRSASTQLKLQNLARSLSPARPDGKVRKGASVVGWSEGLNQLGAGPYRLVGASTLDEALGVAARAIRLTAKPVGLLMWQGRHAWVMSGFRATRDPLGGLDFKVTAATLLDPLYPRVSPRWGRGPRPGEVMTVAALGKHFLPRRAGPSANVWLSGFGGMYVMVVPYRMIRHGSARRP
ncbi:MAG: hypothetical protein E6J17_09825 [Chloroflexi bacterium]|nr:MAG: hypothetical protein E6J17_09825 [Chloroflexota bacterium]